MFNMQDNADTINESEDERGFLNYGKLRVCHVDKKRLVVCIEANLDLKKDSPMLGIELLGTEDAKRLAMRQALKMGWADPTIKDTTIMFNDPKDPTKAVSPMVKTENTQKPYLLVEVFSPMRYEFAPIGDSL